MLSVFFALLVAVVRSAGGVPPVPSTRSPSPWPTYAPGEPREGEPIMPLVPADPSSAAIQADASWAVEYLRGMSDSGVYKTLALRRVVSASTQEGVFHNNTVLLLELESPHTVVDSTPSASSPSNSAAPLRISTHEVVVMTELESGQRRAFAIDEFPVMDPEAVERFWRAKVDAQRGEREAMFAALEAEAKASVGSGDNIDGRGNSAGGDSSASSSSFIVSPSSGEATAVAPPARAAASVVGGAEISLESSSNANAMPIAAAPAASKEAAAAAAAKASEGTCSGTPLSEAAMAHIRWRLANPGKGPLEDPNAMDALRESGAARVMEGASKLTPEQEETLAKSAKAKDEEFLASLPKKERKALLKKRREMEEQAKREKRDEVAKGV